MTSGALLVAAVGLPAAATGEVSATTDPGVTAVEDQESQEARAAEEAKAAEAKAAEEARLAAEAKAAEEARLAAEAKAAEEAAKALRSQVSTQSDPASDTPVATEEPEPAPAAEVTAPVTMAATSSNEETRDTGAPPTDTMVDPLSGTTEDPTGGPTDKPENPKHEFQNLTVTKTATATFDREYKWDIDKSVVGEKKVWIPETETATFDYVVTVTPKGVHDSNWRITGTITVHNPNEFSVEADVTDRVRFDQELSVLGGEGNGGPGNSGHGDDDGDDAKWCDVVGGKDVVIPAGESEVLQYTCTFESVPSDSGINTATAKWKPYRHGDDDAMPVEQMSGSSDDGQNQHGNRSASGTMPFIFEASEINETVSVHDDKTDPDNPVLLGVTDFSDGPFEYKYSLEIDGVVGKCTSYTNTAWLDYGDSEGGLSLQPLTRFEGTEEHEYGKDSDSVTVTVCVKRVPPPPTWADETCNADGSQNLGSITIPDSDYYQYKIDGVEVAAGTYKRPAGEYVVTAKYNGPRGHEMEAASLVPFSGEEAGHSGQGGQGGHENGEGGNGNGQGWGYGKTWTWNITIDPTPVCPVLTKTAAPADKEVVKTGDMITYTITVYNGGDATSTGPVVDTLPIGVSAPSSISDDGVPTARTITWTLEIAPMTTKVLTYSVTVTAVPGEGPLANSVSWEGLTATTTHLLPPAVVPPAAPPAVVVPPAVAPPVTAPPSSGAVVDDTEDAVASEEDDATDEEAVAGTEDQLAATGAGNATQFGGIALVLLLLGSGLVIIGRRRGRA